MYYDCYDLCLPSHLIGVFLRSNWIVLLVLCPIGFSALRTFEME